MRPTLSTTFRKKIYKNNVNMKVLVFWKTSRTTSVIDEDDLGTDVLEGQESTAKYEGKTYKIKVLKKSGTCSIYRDKNVKIFENKRKIGNIFS